MILLCVGARYVARVHESGTRLARLPLYGRRHRIRAKAGFQLRFQRGRGFAGGRSCFVKAGERLPGRREPQEVGGGVCAWRIAVRRAEGLPTTSCRLATGTYNVPATRPYNRPRFPEIGDRLFHRLAEPPFCSRHVQSLSQEYPAPLGVLLPCQS